MWLQHSYLFLNSYRFLRPSFLYPMMFSNNFKDRVLKKRLQNFFFFYYSSSQAFWQCLEWGFCKVKKEKPCTQEEADEEQRLWEWKTPSTIRNIICPFWWNLFFMISFRHLCYLDEMRSVLSLYIWMSQTYTHKHTYSTCRVILNANQSETRSHIPT